MENVDIFKALANSARLQILFWLKNPQNYFVHTTGVDMDEFGVCVQEIQKKLGMTQSTTSQYLSILQKAGLLKATRIGKYTYFKRNEDRIQQLSIYVRDEL